MYDTHKKAELAIVKTMERCLRLGYIVSRPTYEQARYDLVIDQCDGTPLRRTQVKYTAFNETEGSYSVFLEKRQTAVHKTYSTDDIDDIIIYIEPADAIVRLPAKLIAGKKTVTVRTTPSKNGQKKGTILVEDFKF